MGWALLLAREAGVEARPAELSALFLGVWTVYLGDRILDAARRRGEPGLPARQVWGARHRSLLQWLAALACGGAVVGALPHLGGETVRTGAAVALATGLYFFAFRRPRGDPSRTPSLSLPAKEFAIGTVFAAGVSVAAVAGRIADLPWAWTAGMALLFSGNCLLVARSEQDSDTRGDAAAYYARPGALPFLPEFVFGLAVTIGVALALAAASPAAWALVLSGGASLVLARRRKAEQAAADAVLLVPWLFLLLA